MTIAANMNSDPCSGLEYTKKYIKQLLKNTLFVGIFQEKRFVEDLNAYRDIVTVCSEEKDFIKNLEIAKKKIDTDILYKPWVGITLPEVIGAPVQYSLWVVLQQEVFGKYWYKVKTVEFLNCEIRLKLEIVRPFQTDFTDSENSAYEIKDLSSIIEEKKVEFKRYLAYFLEEILTYENVKATLKFLSVLFSTLILGLLKCFPYLFDYILKFMRGLTDLIKAITPICTTVLNLIREIIFQLLHYTFLLFRSNRKPAPIYNYYLSIDSDQITPYNNPRARYNKYLNKAVPYYPNVRKGPTITELYS